MPAILPPSTLSPSKISSFKNCPLAFKFSYIDQLEEPPSIPAVQGTLVHRALQRLFFDLPEGKRSTELAYQYASSELIKMREDDEDLIGLSLDDTELQALLKKAYSLIDGYFRLEDPNEIHTVGTEISLEAEVGGTILRGIIDRLDMDDNGNFIVTDYKTGRAPASGYEKARFSGVNLYALLCERVLGIRPVKVQLLYLQKPCVISAVPSDQVIAALHKNVSALWTAVTRACSTGSFIPRPSALCNWCGFKGICPAHQDMGAQGVQGTHY